ncbi:MAG: alpha/beta hydrolase-fold protein [Actinocatenispora sp.]
MTVMPGTDPEMSAAVELAARGDTTAVEDLWRRATVAKGPLIGPGPGPDDHDLLATTFLWRGEADRVVLIGPCDYADLTRTELARVPGTDLWHLTVLLPRGMRASYGFSIDDTHDAVAGDSELESVATWQPDPINPDTFVWGCNTDGSTPDRWTHRRSALYLPPAGPSRWVAPRPDVPAGEVSMHRMRAADTGLDRDHRVWVYVPVGVPTDGSTCPTVVLTDGDCYVEPMLATPTVLDNLIADGRIPPSIAVLVESLDNRATELNGDPAFLRFLAGELMDWAARHWPVTADPARTVIGGSSLGGTCAAFAALTAPERFGLILSQSGAFQAPAPPAFPEGTIDGYAERPRLPLRWYLSVGTLEVIPDTRSGAGDTLRGANRRMRDVLAARGYPVDYVEHVGAHDYLWWRDTLADGLVSLLGREATGGGNG